MAEHEHHHELPIPTDGVFDLSEIPQEELNDQFQFLERLSAGIPEEWRSKPVEEQKRLLIHMLNHFRRHESLDETQYKQLRTDYQKLVRAQYRFLHPELTSLDTYGGLREKSLPFYIVLECFLPISPSERIFPPRRRHVFFASSRKLLPGNFLRLQVLQPHS